MPGDLISYTFSLGGHCYSVRHVSRETQCQLVSVVEHTWTQQCVGLSSSIQKATREGVWWCHVRSWRKDLQQQNKKKQKQAGLCQQILTKRPKPTNNWPALENSRQNDVTELVTKIQSPLHTPRFRVQTKTCCWNRTTTEHSPPKKDDKLFDSELMRCRPCY